MYGKRQDVLGFQPEDFSHFSGPGNRYINDAAITIPGVGVKMGENLQASIVSQRNTMPALVNQAQPNQISVQARQEKLMSNGGVVLLPQHYGSLYKNW